VTLPKGKAASIRWLPLNVEVFNILLYYHVTNSSAQYTDKPQEWLNTKTN